MSENKPLKIMYLNPLASSASYDSIFADMARDHKLPQTEVHVASLPESEGGFTHIEFRAYEAMVTRGIIRAVRAAAREGFDALAIGCFYDTALHDAREISGGMIVTAPCAASCEIAASLANRFEIIVGAANGSIRCTRPCASTATSIASPASITSSSASTISRGITPRPNAG